MRTALQFPSRWAANGDCLHFPCQGVQVDEMGTDPTDEEAKSSPGCRTQFETEECCILLRQQKHLHHLTERALRKNQPLIILNLMHEKVPFLVAEDLNGTPKLEQMCLQALSMCAFPGEPLMEISVTSNSQEDKEVCLSNSKGSTPPVSNGMAIADSDLPKFVSHIFDLPNIFISHACFFLDSLSVLV